VAGRRSPRATTRPGSVFVNPWTPDQRSRGCQYAHELYPRAPNGLRVGRSMANESRKFEPTPSPRLLELPVLYER